MILSKFFLVLDRYCHGRDSNNDGVDFSQLGGGADFSRLGGGANFPTLKFPSSVLEV
jgi:hypothetical protein